MEKFFFRLNQVHRGFKDWNFLFKACTIFFHYFITFTSNFVLDDKYWLVSISLVLAS